MAITGTGAAQTLAWLILGPPGLFAVEVKYVNGTFRITPARWTYVKIDRYGIAHGRH